MEQKTSNFVFLIACLDGNLILYTFTYLILCVLAAGASIQGYWGSNGTYQNVQIDRIPHPCVRLNMTMEERDGTTREAIYEGIS